MRVHEAFDTGNQFFFAVIMFKNHFGLPLDWPNSRKWLAKCQEKNEINA
jgi:hypothetical protein